MVKIGRDGVYEGDKLSNEIGVVQATINAIVIDTNEIQGDWTNGGRLDLLLDSVLASETEIVADLVTVQASLNAIGNWADLQASVNQAVADLAVVQATANALQNDWKDGGRLDLLLDSVLASETLIVTDIGVVQASVNTLKGDWDDGGRLDLLLDSVLASEALIVTDLATLQATGNALWGWRRQTVSSVTRTGTQVATGVDYTVLATTSWPTRLLRVSIKQYNSADATKSVSCEINFDEGGGSSAGGVELVSDDWYYPYIADQGGLSIENTRRGPAYDGPLHGHGISVQIGLNRSGAGQTLQGYALYETWEKVT